MSLKGFPIVDCQGTRLNQAARYVFIENNNLPQLTALPIRPKPFLKSDTCWENGAKLRLKYSKKWLSVCHF